MDFSQMFFPVVTGLSSQTNNKAVVLATSLKLKNQAPAHSNSMIFRTANLTHYSLMLWKYQKNLRCYVSTIRKHSSTSSVVCIASSNQWLL